MVFGRRRVDVIVRGSEAVDIVVVVDEMWTVLMMFDVPER